MKTPANSLEAALNDYRNNLIYLDSAGNWRWSRRTGVRSVHPANKQLRQLGGCDEVHAAAYRLPINVKQFESVTMMLRAAWDYRNIDHDLHRYIGAYYKDPQKQLAAYCTMLSALTVCGVTLNEQWTSVV